ncbi:MAG: glycosyltransferase family 39 protein [Bacteroidales bacterium]|nr:glycosyltransferase family 39 protein [Bacteroidales bacterium]
MKKYFTYPVVLFLWVLAIHIITVGNSYNMDDDYVIESNEQVHQGISAIPDIFTSFYVQLEKITFYYRPIPKVLFALEYEIFGNNPHAFHFIQVMLFVLLVLVLWLFFLQLFGETHKKSIFWGLMLFVVFPTNTEVIASLKNVDIILAGLFAFLALRFFLQFHDQKKWWILLISFPLLFLSVISKQDGLLYWVAGATGILILRDKKIRNFVITAVFTMAAFGLYRIIVNSMGAHGRVTQFYENPLFSVHDRSVHFSTGLGVIWFYLKMLLIPYPLSYYYGYKILDVFKFSDWQVWAGFAVMTALLAFAILQFRKKKLLTFILLGFVGSLFFYSNILFIPLAGIVGERYLFLPSLFFLFFLTFFFLDDETFHKSLSKIKVGLFVLLGIYAIISVQRDRQWKDRGTLYSHDIKHLGNSVKANELYATLVINNVNNSLRAGKSVTLLRDSLQLAETYFKQALKIYPPLYSAHTNLGLINMIYKKDMKAAVYHFGEATKSAVDFVGKVEEERLYYYYGYCLMQVKEYDKAKPCFSHACELNSANVMAYSLWSAAEVYTKNFDKAVEINNYLISKKLGGVQPYLNLGMCYMEMGKKNTGANYFKQALAVQPDNKVAWRHLAAYYQDANKVDSARYYAGSVSAGN